MKVVVLGANGFVGSAVVGALAARGEVARPVRAPRLFPVGTLRPEAIVDDYAAVIDDLADSFHGADTVINAAGNPDASSRDLAKLVGANAILPAVVAAAGIRAGVGRLVHVSSAVVQGRAAVLDESARTESFSAYSRSKEAGEQLLATIEGVQVVIYRPPSVHGADRRITRALSALASSPLSSVAGAGLLPTPQAHIVNVGDAIAYLATCRQRPPLVVIHPWEGFTTSSFLRLLGRRRPIGLPASLARTIVRVVRCVSYVVPALSAHSRRLELVWFGQHQASSWLELQEDWAAPAKEEAWRDLADAVREPSRGLLSPSVDPWSASAKKGDGSR